MNQDEKRQLENYALSRPLSEIEDAAMLAYLGSIIQNHDHLREKLMSENDRQKRRWKLDAMRPHLHFHALSADKYELAEAARACGVQPIYQEQQQIEKARIWMPPSQLHEVRE